MSVADLRKQYPELAGVNLVGVDIVDSGETLATLPDGQEDFVIAGQFIEHCQNPVRALVNMLRVVRNGGFVFLTVPDMRFTRDKARALTSNEHLLEECLRGTEPTRRSHFVEFARDSEGISDPAEAEKRADWLMSVDYSIHYHVWDSDSFLDFLLFAKRKFKLPCEIQATCRNGDELIVILQKSVA
jgi:SAM-dependent methyltransferase